MKKILLYQHGSSYNHGCEALAYTISKTTREIFPNSYITLASYFADDDKEFDFPYINSIIQNNMWLKRGSIPYFVYQMDKRLFNSKFLQDKFMYCKTCFKLATENDICIAIGGDNYCYNKGKEHWALDRKIKKSGKKLMLWGCSIEPEDIPGEMAEHLSNFDLITVRDPISYQALIDNHVNAKIIRCADPAFLLPIEECILPDGWEPEKMIGLNFSPMVMGNIADKDGPRHAIDSLVEHILDSTDDKIILIPHVRISFTDDMDELKRIYDKYSYTKRVLIVDDKSLNARQLKYIISKCKILVGARTHATIAAYSTCVPTLAIGYSVKARGIARDLFGSEEGKIISIKTMDNQTLIDIFDGIYNNLDSEREYLKKIIPDYSKKALLSGKALKELINDK